MEDNKSETFVNRRNPHKKIQVHAIARGHAFYSDEAGVGMMRLREFEERYRRPTDYDEELLVDWFQIPVNRRAEEIPVRSSPGRPVQPIVSTMSVDNIDHMYETEPGIHATDRVKNLRKHGRAFAKFLRRSVPFAFYDGLYKEMRKYKKTNTKRRMR